MRVAALEKEAEAEDSMNAKLFMIAENAAAKDGDTEKKKDDDAGGLAIMRVKFIGNVNVTIEKLNKAMTDAEDDLQSTEQTIEREFTDDVLENLQTALDATKDKKANWLRVVENCIKKCNRTITEMNKCTSHDELKEMKKIIDHDVGSIGKGVGKEFTLSKAALIRAVNNAKRKNNIKAGAKAATGAKPAESLPPLVEVSKALWLKMHGKLTNGSVFEAKAGIKASKVTSENYPGSTITSIAKVKKACRDLAGHLKTNNTGVVPVQDLPLQRKLLKTLKDAFDANLFATVSLPANADWAAKVFGFHIEASNTGHCAVSTPHMGLMRNTLLFSGEQIVIGIPVNPEGGKMLIKELRKTIYTSTVDALEALVMNGGYIHFVKAGELLVTPSGYIQAIICTEDCVGIGWSCTSDENDRNRVISVLGTLLEQFPETGNPSTGYSQFYDYLRTL